MDADSPDPELPYMTGWKTAGQAEQKTAEADRCSPCNPRRFLGTCSTERPAYHSAIRSSPKPNAQQQEDARTVECSPHRVFHSNEDEQSRQTEPCG